MTGLCQSLQRADLALTVWGRWARGELTHQAWPRESPMFRALREQVLGISARSTATAGTEFVELEIVQLDQLLARLPTAERAALRAHYLDRLPTRFHCARRAKMSVATYDRCLQQGRRLVTKWLITLDLRNDLCRMRTVGELVH